MRHDWSESQIQQLFTQRFVCWSSALCQRCRKNYHSSFDIKKIGTFHFAPLCLTLTMWHLITALLEWLHGASQFQMADVTGNSKGRICSRITDKDPLHGLLEGAPRCPAVVQLYGEWSCLRKYSALGWSINDWKNHSSKAWSLATTACKRQHGGSEISTPAGTFCEEHICSSSTKFSHQVIL